MEMKIGKPPLIEIKAENSRVAIIEKDGNLDFEFEGDITPPAREFFLLICDYYNKRLGLIEEALQILGEADSELGRYCSIRPDDITLDWAIHAYSDIGDFWYKRIVKFISDHREVFQK